MNDSEDVYIGKTFDAHHTLDSDEELENRKDSGKLSDEDIDGQEDVSVPTEQTDSVVITPFNLRDEMKEGYFDKMGFYVAKEDAEPELKDNWLDNLQYEDIAENKQKADEGRANREKQLDRLLGEDLSEIQLRSCILSYLKPGENVGGAIRRLGKSSKSSSKNRRSPEQLQQETQCSNLMSYVNRMVENGQYEIYEATFESLSYALSNTSTERKRILNSEDSSDDTSSEGEANRPKRLHYEQSDKSPSNFPDSSKTSQPPEDNVDIFS